MSARGMRSCGLGGRGTSTGVYNMRLLPGMRQRWVPPCRRSRESHSVSHAAHRLLGHCPALRRARREGVVQPGGIRAQLCGPRADRNELRLHRFEEHLLAVDAAPACRAALRRHMLDRCRRAECLMEVIDVAHLGRSRIGPLDPFRVGHCRTKLRPDLLLTLEQADRVAHGLAVSYTHLTLPTNREV